MKNEIKNYYSNLKNNLSSAKTIKAVKIIEKIGINHMRKFNQKNSTKDIRSVVLKEYHSLLQLTNKKRKELNR